MGGDAMNNSMYLAHMHNQAIDSDVISIANVQQHPAQQQLVNENINQVFILF
jgi:hypothetical protein